MNLRTVLTAALVPALVITTMARADIGVASVYDEDTETASLEPFNRMGLTVAHPKAAWVGPVKFGSCLAVSYKSRSIIVRINDNGPHIKNRVLDFTPRVAELLKFSGLDVVEFWPIDCLPEVNGRPSRRKKR